jgi:hypothetical protein
MKKKFSEDAPTNSTGPHIVGTNGDPSEVTKKKKKKSKVLKRLKGTYEVGRKPDKNLEFWANEDRDYRKEYDNYHAQPEQRKKNAARLRARRLMVKKGKAKKNDKMDVHHKDNNPLNNDPKNLSIVTQKYNRTEPRRRDEDVDLPTPTPDSTFASMPVFNVNGDDFVRCQDGKKKHAHWNKYIDTESDYGKKIHGYAKKNPKQSIIVQDDKTGHMVYLKKYSQLEK